MSHKMEKKLETTNLFLAPLIQQNIDVNEPTSNNEY